MQSLSKAQQVIRTWVNNNTYFVQYVIYSCFVTLTSAVLLTLIQSFEPIKVDFFDALFLSISCFSCTGLFTRDYSHWSTTSLVVMLITIQLGGIVLSSTFPSILRLRALMSAPPVHSKTLERALNRHTNVHRTLIRIAMLYWFVFQLTAFLCLLAYNSPWWACFTAMSAFNNAGFKLTSSAFTLQVKEDFTIIVLTFLMPLGNSLYPVYQRLLIRFYRRLLCHCVLTDKDQWWLGGMSTRAFLEGLTELLERPRRYYTHLFDGKATVYLFLMWLALTLMDFLLFLPDLGTNVFPPNLHGKDEWIASIFQTITIRTTGFMLVNVSFVREGHIAYWVMAMYLSAFPYLITERTTRPKEAAASFTMGSRRQFFPRALMDGEISPTSPGATPSPQASSHDSEENEIEEFLHVVTNLEAMKEQFQVIRLEIASNAVREVGWLYLVVILIGFMENHHIGFEGQLHETEVFARLIFEVTSAYGTVGLSLSALSYRNVSFSGSLSSRFSQLLILACMYAGKFRMLPANVDVADVERALITRAMTPRSSNTTPTTSPRNVRWNDTATTVDAYRHDEVAETVMMFRTEVPPESVSVPLSQVSSPPPRGGAEATPNNTPTPNRSFLAASRSPGCVLENRSLFDPPILASTYVPTKDSSPNVSIPSSRVETAVDLLT